MAKKQPDREIVDDLDKMMEKLELPKRVIIAEIIDAEDVKLPEKKDKK